MANIGNTSDEDIDIKIVIKKKCICKIKDIAVPERNIYRRNIKNDFFGICVSN